MRTKKTKTETVQQAAPPAPQPAPDAAKQQNCC
jgi:hypothetical protein